MRNALAAIAVVVAIAAGVTIMQTRGNAGQASSQPGAKRAESSAGAATDSGPVLGVSEDDPVERLDVPVSNVMPQRGRADAPVTIVEFSDFECPFCNAVLPSLREVEETYGDKVRIVWRNQPLPIHPHAQLAAEAALEAHAQGGNAKFWAMHDKLFANRDALTRADLDRYAGELGLNAATFKIALDSHTHAEAIKSDMGDAVRVGVRGTPAFFINGRVLVGAKPTVAFKELIDDELSRVVKLQAKNVPADRVYATLMASAKKIVDPKRKPAVAQTVYKVPVSDADPQQGPADALVTMVMFGDFEDKFTRQAADTVNTLRQKYSADLRVVWKNVPLSFHDNAKNAATLAMEAFAQGGNELFWQAHQLLLQNQGALGTADLERYAAQLGLKPAALKAALTRDAYKAKIDADVALVPRLLSIFTTPLFTINGRFIRGAAQPDLFQATIEEELVKAKAKLASGTPKAKLYEEIIRDGRSEAAELTADQKATLDKVYDIPVPNDAPTLGGKHAKVVLQEFSDFQCPFCARALPILATLRREYGDKIKLVWRDYPLPIHADAALAAQAAREVFTQAKSDKFWAYNELLFKNQSALSRADLEKYAEQIGGVNMQKFRAALDNQTHAARVKADVDAYTSSGSHLGTPGFFINGRLLEGALPIEAFRAMIDRELSRK